jgi:hypothetical protein
MGYRDATEAYLSGLRATADDVTWTPIGWSSRMPDGGRPTPGVRIRVNGRGWRWATCETIAPRGAPAASRPTATWRIFFTLRENRDDRGLHAVLRDPDIIAAVVYVTNAPPHEDVVVKARNCKKLPSRPRPAAG